MDFEKTTCDVSDSNSECVVLAAIILLIPILPEEVVDSVDESELESVSISSLTSFVTKPLFIWANIELTKTVSK